MKGDNLFIRFGVYDGLLNLLPVYKDGAYVGDIRGTSFGWMYRPKGATDNKVSRITWVSIGLLKQHLEANL